MDHLFYKVRNNENLDIEHSVNLVSDMAYIMDRYSLAVVYARIDEGKMTISAMTTEKKSMKNEPWATELGSAVLSICDTYSLDGIYLKLKCFCGECIDTKERKAELNYQLN